MNSLLGNFGNLFSQLTSTPNAVNGISTQPNILMQAMGAALRGESPQQFMQNLAQTHPQLRQYDLTNLQQTAQQVCQQNGVDISNATQQLDNLTNSIMPK